MILSIRDEKAIVNKHFYIKNDGIIHDAIGICDCSLMLGCQYLGLDICSQNNRIYGISGFLSIERLPQETIVMPRVVKEGALYLSECTIEANTAKDYLFPLEGKYDKKQKIVCLGDNMKGQEAIKITDEVFVSVRDGKILAIYICSISF